MWQEIGKYIVQLFGLFFVAVGVLMLLKPTVARATLRKAGSTPFINYAEITLRILPAIGLILSAPVGRFPLILSTTGWFMIATSLVLYFIPRKMHHAFSNRAADFLKPLYFQFIAPFSMTIGYWLLYVVF